MPQKNASVTTRTQEGSKPQKRKADEAFRTNVRKQPSSKVVSFQDDEVPTGDHQGSSKRTATQNGDKSSNVGRLKRRAQELLSTRLTLPISPHADEIRSKLADNDVLLLVGETGSGKSTQIPQFLLDQKYTRRTTAKDGSTKVGGCIAITQPRRVAAISLARRVAEEVGTPLGNSSPASQVGYSVRFDTSMGSNTRIKFLTDGMLLQELLRDPWMREYSVVVVDEVHERGVNVDLVLGFLKRIVEGRNEKDGRRGIPLKVVVMSATADMERIEKSFVSTGNQENGHSNGTSKHSADGKDDSITTHSVRLTSCFIKGRQYPVKVNYTPQPVSSSWDAAMERITQIHQHTPLPGDILVFLPGQEAIDSLESMCISYANSLFQQSKQKGAPKIPKLLILPLFAALPTAAQQRVFESTPPFTRKIILSTNIAETSVTVPGIRHVIDTGKRKARFFRPALNLDTLLTQPISRSSAKQRAGRAGREAPGSCWRLYTEKTFYELEADTEPEILRCDLSQLVLTLKAHGVDDILSFPLLTSPPIKALERALIHLLQLKALDPKTGHITDLGRKMSSLPLPANLARALLASMEPQYNCLAEMIDIVSGLSVENIWLPIHNRPHTARPDSELTPAAAAAPPTTNIPEEDEEEPTNPITLARRTLYRRTGDHLTLLAALQAYASEPTDRKSWCRRHGISHRAMTAATDISKQLSKLTSSHHKPSASADSPLDTRILRALLTGLHTNTAHLTTNSGGPTGSAPYRTYYTGKPIQVHPSSVLFSRDRAGRAPDIVFSEFVYTTRPYARCVSEVRAEWVEGVMREVEDQDQELDGGGGGG